MRVLATVAVVIGAVLVAGAYLGPSGGDDADRPESGPAGTRFAVATTAVRVEGGGRLGVRVVDAPDEAGAEVVELDEGGAAASAGLAVGDVVRSIDGVSVRGADHLATVIGTHEPGDTVTVELDRDGSHEVDATLD